MKGYEERNTGSGATKTDATISVELKTASNVTVTLISKLH